MNTILWPILLDHYTSTFNGLGTSFTDALLNIFSGISLDDKVTNYYADLVGAIVGFHPGEKIPVFIENESVLEDHSISKLVESLSVYRILALIDPSLDSSSGFEKIDSILDATSIVELNSLQNSLQDIGEVFQLDSTLYTDTEKVIEFYEAIDDKITTQFSEKQIRFNTLVEINASASNINM